MIKFLKSLPQMLTRITSGRKLIKEIDGLRFVAFLPVVIQHLTERFERNTAMSPSQFTAYLVQRGFLGVYIFFVISGFVLSLPFAAHRLKEAKKVNILAYFWRRLTRLEPPYIIWMTVFFFVFIIHNHQAFTEYLPHYLATISYSHGLIYHLWSPFNPSAWTLEIEIQFYILAPILAYFFFCIKSKRTRRCVNVILVFLIMFAQQYFKFYLNPYNLTILGHLHYFLIGFILADIYLCDWTIIKRNGLYDLSAVLALVSLIYCWSWGFELQSRFAVVISLFCSYLLSKEIT